MAEALLDHDAEAHGSRHRNVGRKLVGALLAQPKVVFGGGFILLLLVLALFAPLIAPHDPLAQDLLAGTLPPRGLAGSDPGFVLGTDDLGRDVLSRLIFGTRVALVVAFAAAALAA